MKNTNKKFAVILIAIVIIVSFASCSLSYSDTPISATSKNIEDTKRATENILTSQETPTDIDFSLERFNLIRRAYWVNGQREKAAMVPCNVDRPLGYIVLLTKGGSILGRYVVDGKVSSLNSYLSPDSEYFELIMDGHQTGITSYNRWLADVDGSYGTNTDGIFWFTPDGHYIEWSGDYLYSDIPFVVDDPVLKIE